VIAASPYPRDLFGAALSALRNRGPRIAYFHHLINPPSHDTKSRGGLLRVGSAWLYQEFALKFSRMARFTIALNETSDSQFLASHPAPESMAIQGCLSSALTESESTVEATYDACFSGRVSAQKGVWDLLSIWRRVCDSRPSAKLAIVGPRSKLDDRLREEWIELDMDENIVRVSATGNGTHWKIIRASRVFLFPSYEEGWSLSVMEAAWLSVPVVAYDLPAYSYLRGALLSHPPGDIEAMSISVLRLLEDEEERGKLIARAKAGISRYVPGVVASGELRSILSLIESRRNESG
jgi:glycosyltransferase involved in cell wall biosynthesis